MYASLFYYLFFSPPVVPPSTQMLTQIPYNIGILWCDSGCPICPSGLIGSSGGSSSSSDPDDDDDDDDDDNDSSSTTSTTTTTTSVSYTAAGFHIDAGDTSPTTTEAWSVIESVLSALIGYSSDDGSGSSTNSDSNTSTDSNGNGGTATTTTTSKATTTTSTVSTPSATSVTNEVTFSLFELYSGYTWIFEWTLMDTIIGETWYPCDTSSDITTTAEVEKATAFI